MQKRSMQTACSILMLVSMVCRLCLVQATYETCTTYDKTKVAIGERFKYKVDTANTLGRVYYIAMDDMMNHYKKARALHITIEMDSAEPKMIMLFSRTHCAPTVQDFGWKIDYKHFEYNVSPQSTLTFTIDKTNLDPTSCYSMTPPRNFPIEAKQSCSAFDAYSPFFISGFCQNIPHKCEGWITIKESCLPGYYQNQNQCATCPAGMYSGMEEISCKKCAKGNFSIAGASECSYNINSCPKGHYANVAKSANVDYAAECLPCPPGRFNNILGQINASSCIRCPNGKYGETHASITNMTCKYCPAGRFVVDNPQTESPDTCNLCPSGRYKSIESTLKCTQCVAGKYLPNSYAPTALNHDDEKDCLKCPAGRYSDKGSSRCYESCRAGEFPVDGTNQCELCLAGFVSDEGDSNCTICPPGRFSNLQYTLCLACPHGKYAEMAGRSKIEHCISCPPGKFSDLDGVSSIKACQNCPAGTASSDEGAIGLKHCEHCKVGQYSAQPGQSSCQRCEAGKVTSFTRSTNCTKCSVGKFDSVNDSYTPRTLCVSCPIGKYNNENGGTKCKDCLEGETTHGFGSTDCFLCPKGKYLDNIDCKSCVHGRYSSFAGAISCTQCAAGQITYTNGSTRCYPCQKGKYQSTRKSISLSNIQACVQCPKHTYTDAEGSSSCINCTIGSITYTEGSTTCLQCPAGMYFKNYSCLLCEVGTFSSDSGSINSCKHCPAGKESITPGSSRCWDCPRGKFAAWGDDKIFCETCKKGKYSYLLGSTECISCPKGKFAALEGSRNCSACPAGTTPEISRTACVDCPKGRYAKVGFESCKTCDSTAIVNSRQSGCTTCKPGFFVSNTGDHCIGCPSGTYQNIHGACEQCPVGRYNSVPGAFNSSSCFECPVGRYSDAMGATELVACKLCPLGQTTTLKGQYLCVKCAAISMLEQAQHESCAPCTPGKFFNENTSMCEKCTKGKFRANPGHARCMNCPFASYNSASGMSTCLQCPVGRITRKGAKKESLSDCLCPDGEYLKKQQEESCVTCPVGGLCKGLGTIINTVQAKPGYWRGSETAVDFQECFDPSFCIGGVLNSSQGICRAGHQGHKCHACRNGKSQEEKFRKLAFNDLCILCFGVWGWFILALVFLIHLALWGILERKPTRVLSILHHLHVSGSTISFFQALLYVPLIFQLNMSDVLLKTLASILQITVNIDVSNVILGPFICRDSLTDLFDSYFIHWFLFFLSFVINIFRMRYRANQIHPIGVINGANGSLYNKYVLPRVYGGLKISISYRSMELFRLTNHLKPARLFYRLQNDADSDAKVGLYIFHIALFVCLCSDMYISYRLNVMNHKRGISKQAVENLGEEYTLFSICIAFFIASLIPGVPNLYVVFLLFGFCCVVMYNLVMIFVISKYQATYVQPHSLKRAIETAGIKHIGNYDHGRRYNEGDKVIFKHKLHKFVKGSGTLESDGPLSPDNKNRWKAEKHLNISYERLVHLYNELCLNIESLQNLNEKINVISQNVKMCKEDETWACANSIPEVLTTDFVQYAMETMKDQKYKAVKVKTKVQLDAWLFKNGADAIILELQNYITKLGDLKLQYEKQIKNNDDFGFASEHYFESVVERLQEDIAKIRTSGFEDRILLYTAISNPKDRNAYDETVFCYLGRHIDRHWNLDLDSIYKQGRRSSSPKKSMTLSPRSPFKLPDVNGSYHLSQGEFKKSPTGGSMPVTPMKKSNENGPSIDP